MAKGFVCPKCDSTEIGVVQTIQLEDAITRRRKCANCNTTFYTFEVKSYMISTDPDFDFLFRKAPAQ